MGIGLVKGEEGEGEEKKKGRSTRVEEPVTHFAFNPGESSFKFTYSLLHPFLIFSIT
jgi:hypothetical protein